MNTGRESEIKDEHSKLDSDTTVRCEIFLCYFVNYAETRCIYVLTIDLSYHVYNCNVVWNSFNTPDLLSKKYSDTSSHTKISHRTL
jgi:hypothetical protein